MHSHRLGALVVAGMVAAAAGVESSPIYELRLYNTDDTLRARITNASHASQLFLSNGFGGDTGFVDVSSWVSNGTNTIELSLSNTGSGYTYGYELLRDGVSIDAGACGATNVAGCNGNDMATGTVFVHTLTFGLSAALIPDSLRLYNTDDTLSAFVTNSAFVAQTVLVNTFLGDTGVVDISSYLEPGQNRFDLRLANTFAGYTYGYQFRSGASIVDQGSCGVVGVTGCNANNQARGTVFTHSLLFDAPQPVPEPSTLVLLGGGLLAAIRRLRPPRG